MPTSFDRNHTHLLFQIDISIDVARTIYGLIVAKDLRTNVTLTAPFIPSTKLIHLRLPGKFFERDGRCRNQRLHRIGPTHRRRLMVSPYRPIFVSISSQDAKIRFTQRLRLPAFEFAVVHRRGPGESNGDLAFGEEPEGVFGTFGARIVAVEHEIDSIDAELFGEADDFLALSLRHAVGHDGEGGDTEFVKVDDVVEAFDEGQAVLLDEFAVAGFFEAAGLLAEEFEAPMKTFGEAVFGGWVFA